MARVFAGYTADTFLGPLNSLIISLLLCAVSALAIWPFASSLGVLVFFAIINGIGCGAFFSLFTTVLGAVFGPENTMGVLPMVWTVWFFGFFFVSFNILERLMVHTDLSGYPYRIGSLFSEQCRDNCCIQTCSILRRRNVTCRNDFDRLAPAAKN